MYERRLVKDYFIHEKEKIHNLKIIDRELKVEFIEGKAIAIVGPRRSGKTFFLKSFSLKQNTSHIFSLQNFFRQIYYSIYIFRVLFNPFYIKFSFMKTFYM